MKTDTETNESFTDWMLPFKRDADKNWESMDDNGLIKTRVFGAIFEFIIFHR